MGTLDDSKDRDRRRPADRRSRATVEADGGLRGAVDGQPRLTDLPLSTQLMVQGSAAFDLVLRTAIASTLVIPGALGVARPDTQHELSHMSFYRELAARHDPTASFPAPSQEPRVMPSGPPPFTFAPSDGSVQMLHFESPFRAVNPELRREYARYRENRTAWAQHWRHDDGPRPTLAVIHGFGASPYWLNSLFFSLPWLYEQGYDILLYLLPFHGVRQARAAFSGWGLFAHGISHFNEAMAHAVHDFRLFMDHLFAQGVPQIALTGLSLGGYVSALLAAVEDRLSVVIPNAPVVRIAPLARQWFPAGPLLTAALRLGGIGWEEFQATLDVSSPLNYPVLVARPRRMIIGGLGDRLAPPDQTRWLWEHWGRPRLHWFPGNHILHARRGAYLQEMCGFMRVNGFSAG